MAILRVLHIHIYGIPEELKDDSESVLSPYLWVKFKQKIAYSCWERHVSLKIIVFEAVQQTLHQLKMISMYEVQAKFARRHNLELERYLNEANINLYRNMNAITWFKHDWSLSMLEQPNLTL